MSVPDSKHLFWDTCIIARWLTETPAEYVKSISQYLQEAARGERKILISTITFAELRPSLLRTKQFGTFADLIKDFKAAFIPISPTPDILMRAAIIKDLQFKKDPKNKQEKGRVVGTGDAIQLMTCVYAKEDLGIGDIVFHSFDEGRNSTWEGRTVPPIGFEDWCSGHESNPLVKKVIDLRRSKPEHPNPKMI